MLSLERTKTIKDYANRMGFRTISKYSTIAIFAMELNEWLYNNRPDCWASVNTINDWMRSAGEPGNWVNIKC